MGSRCLMKIVVTGAKGLLGWHTAARLHAVNCTARFRGEPEPYQLVTVDRPGFEDATQLAAAVKGADAILHFAGVNRGSDSDVAEANPAISRALVSSCQATGSLPHIVYANSTHSGGNSIYGTSKREAGEILAGLSGRYTDLVLPHVFGECARPDYNNVTATLIDRLWKGESPTIGEDAKVSLLHAGEAADLAIGAVSDGHTGELAPEGRPLTVSDLWTQLESYHRDYRADIFPHLVDPFDVALFNSYRTGGFPARYPKPMSVRADARGALFETSKARAGSQSFISTTVPGQSRGDHFHLSLVERFLVVSGRATIRVRRVLTDEVFSFEVSGAEPVAVDMPPLHTHHIVNDGDVEVITYFWANRLFDPADPDTYADPVLKDD